MKHLEDHLAQLQNAPNDFRNAIHGLSETVLSKSPDVKNWAAKEIICHMRDVEELYLNRFQAMIVMDEPNLGLAEPDRWAAERQYLRNDPSDALSAFTKRREETLDFLRHLEPAQLERGGIHPSRGRMSIKDMIALMAEHDQNHLDQLKRALLGRP